MEIIEYAINNLNIDYDAYDYHNVEYFDNLMKNPNINYNDIVRFNIFRADDGLSMISMNPNITGEIVITEGNSWNYDELSSNLCFEDIKLLPRNYIDMYDLSKSSKITWDDIKNNPDWHWDVSVFRNPNITMKHIKLFNNYNHLKNLLLSKRMFKLILKNPNIDYDMLITCLNEPDIFLHFLDIDRLAKSNINFLNSKYLLSFINKSDYKDIFYNLIYTFNSNVSIQELKEAQGEPLDTNKCKLHDDDINSNSDKEMQKLNEERLKVKFNWYTFSDSPRITIKDAIKHYEKVNWNKILSNPSISLNEIETNIGFIKSIIHKNEYTLFFNFNNVLLNPHITLDFIKKYLDVLFTKNDLYMIFGNHFLLDKYFSTMKQTKDNLKVYHQELIEKSCSPKRKINWDEDFMDDCKSGFYGDEGLELYINECSKYI